MEFRGRYSETDPPGTFRNARARGAFECGRTERLPAGAVPHVQIEQRGRARYEDRLRRPAWRTSLLGEKQNRSTPEV